MSEHMTPFSFKYLLKWILAEYSKSGSIFNIPSQLFFHPSENSPFETEMFGSKLLTPIGPAAGPHTQLAQNIICSWLTGSRFIELKTVQIMDELDIPRPCIDMTDEGYNVEWSQELKLRQSGSEYVHAWVIIHILRRLLEMENTQFGTIFNMSIGYNLEGIMSDPMQSFIGLMQNAGDKIERIREYIKSEYPVFSDVEIPHEISNNVTLSTMHGCPPDEIQRIGEYLIGEKNLHTVIKMNPTLLGRDNVYEILHNSLGFKYIDIPQKVFDADIGWETAVDLIKNLIHLAEEKNLHFGVKLSNTLAMRNVLERLPGEEVYMSGRALCPVTVNLFKKLQEEFDYTLKVSYSAGADAMNIADIISSGALPVTVASDLLKPGGYGRTNQYLEKLEQGMLDAGANTLEEYQSNAKSVLSKFAAKVLENPWYKKDRARYGLAKLDSELPVLDCITAPCMETCPAKQNPPAYIRRIASGELDAAFQSILKQNPLPGMTGYICPHTCQFKCTRNLYDEPVAIRNLKRYVRDNVLFSDAGSLNDDVKVAVIGAGPAGLSAAAFLAETGIHVTIFEASDKAGGVPALAPDFRIPENVIQKDVDRIVSMGVTIKLNHRIQDPPQQLLEEGFDAVFFSPGFAKDLMLSIPGIDGPDAYGVMDFLARVGKGENFSNFSNVLVIGGGNTAIDAARTAERVTGKPCTIVYRRTVDEMPSWEEELSGFLEENNKIIDLTSPVKINRVDNKIISLTCLKNSLGSPDSSGRPRPEKILNSEHDIKADLIIFAIGQQPDYTTETNIQAVADGHRAAEAISRELGMDATTELAGHNSAEPAWQSILHARTHLLKAEKPDHLEPDKRKGFELIEHTFTRLQATDESKRCMQCDLVCDRCVDVCPNRANVPISIEPRTISLEKIKLSKTDDPVAAGFDYFEIKQNRQIIHLDELCNGCGNCSVFCTHTGDPYKTKPMFFLSRQSFDDSSEDAWFVNEFEMMRRYNNRTYHLLQTDEGYTVHIDDLVIKLNLAIGIKDISGTMVGSGYLSLIPVAEMVVFLESLNDHPVSMNR